MSSFGYTCASPGREILASISNANLMHEVTMSQSDAAMRAGVGGVNVPPPLESAAGVTNLPVAVPEGIATAVWLHARKPYLSRL